MNRMLYQLSYAATRSNVHYTKVKMCVNSLLGGSCLDTGQMSGGLAATHPKRRYAAGPRNANYLPAQKDLPHPARISLHLARRNLQ